MADVANDMEAVLPGLGGLGDAPATVAPGLAPTLDAGVARTDPLAELVRRCQNGDDESAFDELVRRFQPRVFSAIRGILRASNDVEDVAQQVFTKIYFALDSFNFHSAVSTWIYKVTVNECYDHLRKQKVRKVAILSDLSEEESARMENFDRAAHDGQPGLERQIALRELAGKLLARLSAEDRVLLVLKEIEGYSVREVAEILNLNENTAKIRLFRARQALLAALNRKRVK